MNRWAKIVLTLAALATAGWILAGATGYGIVDEASFARHTLLAFVALLALILGHGWIAAFAAVSPARIAKAGDIAPDRLAALRSARRLGVAAAALAMVAAVAQFVISNALFPSRLSRREHLAAASVSVVVLIVSLWLEARALSRHGRAVAALTAARY